MAAMTIALSVAVDAIATVYEATPDNYRTLLGRLQPGDRLALQPGVYRHGLPLHDLHGSAERPIVIEGPARGNPAVLLARPRANTVSLARTSHLVVRNLLLDGLDLPVDAVKAEFRGGVVHHIVLERLTMVRYGVEQGVIGISTKCPTAHWVIRNNLIIGAGTGMYLGNSDGTAPFVAGLIEGNRVIDTRGYNVQIKHQKDRPLDAALPVTRQRTIIRNNFFAKRHGATEGPLARPNLLLGHFPLEGPGADDEYDVHDNVFYANATEALFQAEGNVRARRNLFLNPFGDAVAIIPHNDVPRAIELSDNFVVAQGIGMRIVSGQPPTAQIAVENFVFAGQPLTGGVQRDNRTGGVNDAEAAFAAWADRTAGAPKGPAARDPDLRRRLASICMRDAAPAGAWELPADHFACRWAMRAK